MKKERKDIIKKNEISQIYQFELGGYTQKVLIEGENKYLPIVISLHGGPGTPIPFSVGCRGMFEVFTNQFIMVYWDQYGCGINNAKIDNTFTITKFVKMTEDLICETKKLFPNNKIFLFATSWGSILSAKLLEKSDEIVDGVVVWGQMVKHIFYNEEVYNELGKSKLSATKLENIKNVDIDNISIKDLKLVSSSLKKYTKGYENKDGKTAPMMDIIGGLLTSPDYKFKDFKAIMVNGYMGNLSLWKEILQIDLSDIIKNIKVPYIMIQGDTDIVASSKEVRKIIDNKSGPLVKCVVVKDSGHYPGVDGMEVVLEKLISLKK